MNRKVEDRMEGGKGAISESGLMIRPRSWSSNGSGLQQLFMEPSVIDNGVGVACYGMKCTQ